VPALSKIPPHPRYLPIRQTLPSLSRRHNPPPRLEARSLFQPTTQMHLPPNQPCGRSPFIQTASRFNPAYRSRRSGSFLMLKAFFPLTPPPRPLLRRPSARAGRVEPGADVKRILRKLCEARNNAAGPSEQSRCNDKRKKRVYLRPPLELLKSKTTPTANPPPRRPGLRIGPPHSHVLYIGHLPGVRFYPPIVISTPALPRLL